MAECDPYVASVLSRIRGTRQTLTKCSRSSRDPLVSVYLTIMSARQRLLERSLHTLLSSSWHGGSPPCTILPTLRSDAVIPSPIPDSLRQAHRLCLDRIEGDLRLAKACFVRCQGTPIYPFLGFVIERLEVLPGIADRVYNALANRQHRMDEMRKPRESPRSSVADDLDSGNTRLPVSANPRARTRDGSL